jgi:hypothetical protein
MTETVISFLKRAFKKSVSAKTMQNMVQEMTIKASPYNMLIETTTATQNYTKA